MPCPCSKSVGYEGRKDSVEIEEEEEGPSRGLVAVLRSVQVGCYLHDAADKKFNEKDPG